MQGGREAAREEREGGGRKRGSDEGKSGRRRGRG